MPVRVSFQCRFCFLLLSRGVALKLVKIITADVYPVKHVRRQIIGRIEICRAVEEGDVKMVSGGLPRGTDPGDYLILQHGRADAYEELAAMPVKR